MNTLLLFIARPTNCVLFTFLKCLLIIFILNSGKVIIIDEAHNLIETINQLHSAELSVTQIDCASGAISAYLRRYQSQLSAKNLYYINILSAVLGKLRKVLCPKVAKAKTTTLVAEDASASAGVAFGTSNAKPAAAESGLTVNDFLFKSSLDGINLFKLKRHIEETNLVQKIGGYAESLALKEAASSGTAPAQHTAVGSSKNACGAAAKATVGNTSQERFQQGKSSNGATGNDSRGGAGGVSVRADVVAALRCALELVVCLTNVEGDGRIFLLNRTPPVVPPFATTTGGSTSTATFGASKSAAGEAVGAVTSTSASTPVPAIKFVMLNPSVHFLPLVMEARSVLLLGGTMKPFSYFTSLLFPAVPRERMRLFSCDHVVPAQQVGAVIVPHYEDPVPSSSARSSRVNFEFTYDKRLSTDQTNALFQALIEICANTPGGVVVFCTSFQYLEALLSRWRSSKILYKLDAIKRVFAESRAGCSDTTASSTNSGNTCNNVWEAYKRQVETHPQEGAVLFSVINGKLSEGINFSDELARCVVVVGLPYPDVRDPVLQEKMRYVSAHDTLQVTHGTFAQHLGDAGTCAAGGSGDGNGGGGGGGDKLGCVTVPPVSSQQAGGGVAGAGRKLCENMCMKAVNQSVGRAIRHVHDYACVVLLDRRYMQEQFRSQLPGWILRNIQVCGSGSVNGGGDGQRTLQAHLKSFFASQEKLSK